MLSLPRKRLHEARARETSAHQEQEDLRHHAGDHDVRATPINLGLDTRLVAERHEHPVERLAQLAATLPDVAADCRSDTSTPCSSRSRSHTRWAV